MDCVTRHNLRPCCTTAGPAASAPPPIPRSTPTHNLRLKYDTPAVSSTALTANIVIPLCIFNRLLRADNVEQSMKYGLKTKIGKELIIIIICKFITLTKSRMLESEVQAFARWPDVVC